MITKKDLKFFKICKHISTFSDYPRIKIGCVVVIKNRIISSGYNKVKTHPVQKEYNYYQHEYDIDSATNCIHAEIDTLISLKGTDLNNASMYIFRNNKHGELASCSPCPACRKMITDLNIKHLYYTIDSEYVYEKLR